MRDQDADLHLAALDGLLDETIGLLERYGEDQGPAGCEPAAGGWPPVTRTGWTTFCGPSAAWAASMT
jgi:hypothetical protein